MRTDRPSRSLGGRVSAAAVLVLALASGPAAVAGKPGFIRFEGITGDGGDAAHPGAFASPSLDVPGFGSGGGAGKPGPGAGSVSLQGGGPGLDALVRACLNHQRFASAEVSSGTSVYVFDGVVLNGIQIYGGSMSSGVSVGKAPVVVTFQYTSYRDAHASQPTASSRLGNVGAFGAAPLLIAPTPTAPRPK